MKEVCTIINICCNIFKLTAKLSSAILVSHDMGGCFCVVTCAKIDRMPTTPIKTAIVVEEKLMTCRNIQI